jgi:poly(3-hydroxybutyrate) depolymerase
MPIPASSRQLPSSSRILARRGLKVAAVNRGYARLALALCSAAGSAWPAQSVTLPAWVCAHPDAIFVGGFEAGEIAVPHSPSNGSGGLYSGNRTRSVIVAGLGTQNYYLYLPTIYTPTRPWPLVVALHGAGGPSTSASSAQQARTDWSASALANGFVVAAPVGSDSAGGGWNAPGVNGQGPSDYDAIAAVIADVKAHYNIETTREYAWGFSAGGEVLDDIVLTGWSGMNADTFAGYAVTGTALAGCPTYNTVSSCVPANAARIIPQDIHIGQNDPIYTQGYATSDKNAFLAAGWNLGTTLWFTVFTDGTPAGGHTYTIPQLSDIWTNLCRAAVTP